MHPDTLTARRTASWVSYTYLELIVASLALLAAPVGARAASYSVNVRVFASSGHVTASPIDCYNNSGTCAATFSAPVTLAATPDSGFTVKSWSGCTPSPDLSTCYVPGTASTVVYIYFQSAPPPPPTSYTLITRILAYSGTVTGPGGISCTNGTGACSAAEAVSATVTVKAIPTQGYAAKSWYGCTPDANLSTCTLKMDANKSVSVAFGTVPQTVACTVPNGTGTQAFNSNTNTYDPCVATACATNYSLFGGACYASFSSCAVPNGTGMQGWNSTTGQYDPCTATACDTNYTLWGGACYANSQTCTVPNGSGTQTFNLTTGTYDPCAATACAAGYTLANGVCQETPSTVLIIGAPGSATWLSDVQAKIAATGRFARVDVFNAQSGTPSLAALQGYAAVLVYSDTSFADATTLGNNLADYWDGGGRVVIAVFANASVRVLGRFGTVTNGYMLINPTGQEQPPVYSALRLLEPSSPLVAGVTSLTAQQAYRSTGSPINGGVVVANWGDGKPLIVRGVVKGRNRVDLNFYPPSASARSDFWVGDGATIMANALLYQ